MTRSGLFAYGAVFGVLAACATAPPPAGIPGADAAETHRYCGDRIESTDGYRCLEEVTAEQQTHRNQAWVFTYRANRLVRVAHLNGRGVALDAEHGCGSWEAQWAERELAGATCRDQNGLVRSLVKYQMHGTLVSWRDFRGRPLAPLGGRVVAARRAFDTSGLLVASWTLDATGAPTLPGPGGVTEVWRRRNADGVSIERAYFRADGKPTRDKAGVHRYAHEVDAAGRVLARRAFDEQGTAIADHNHVHLVRTTYDRFGNTSRTEWFDSSDRPVRTADEGAAAVVFVRDSRGAEIERSLLDERGQLVEGVEGWAIRRVTVDRNGFSADITHFGANDTPVRILGGAFEVKIARDDVGNPKSEEAFDVNRIPVGGIDGAARRVTSYDSRMHRTRIAYSAGDGTPAFSRSGYAALEQTFDGDRLVDRRFVDPERHLVNSTEGYCHVTVTYGPDGAESFRLRSTSWPQLPASGWRDTNDLPQLRTRLPKGPGLVEIPLSPTLVAETLASSDQVGASRLFAAALSAYALRRIEDAAFLLMAGDLRATADLSRFVAKGRGRDSPAAFDRSLVSATSGSMMAAINVRPEALRRVLERLRHFRPQSEASYRPEWEVEAEIPEGKWRKSLEVARMRLIHEMEEMLQRVTVPAYLRCLRVVGHKNGNAAARISDERAKQAAEALARSGGAKPGAHGTRSPPDDLCNDDDLDRDWLPPLWVNGDGMVTWSKVIVDIDNP